MEFKSNFVKKNYQHINANWCTRVQPNLWREIDTQPADESLEISETRDGNPTLRIGQVQIHSKYDPVREAETLADKALVQVEREDTLIVLGFGLGYFAEAIQKRHSGKIIVIEPDLPVVKAAFRTRDLTKLAEITFICGKSTEDTGRYLSSMITQRGNEGSVRVIHFPPALRLHEEYYDEITRIINTKKNLTTNGLRILVVNPVYGGSLPVAKYCASAFERLGHHVETLDNEVYDSARQLIENSTSNRSHRNQLTGLLTTLMSETIVAKALDRCVDLVFCVAQSPMSPRVIEELHRNRIPVAFWFVEDWRLFTYWREWAPLYDYFFTIQKGQFHDALNSIGVRHAHYLPMAADPDVHRPVDLSAGERKEFGSLISHIGAGYQNRRHVFMGMTDLDFKLWGNDWDLDSSLSLILQRNGERISTEESIKIFNSTDININLHSSTFHTGVDPDGDFLNPRTFEIAACGGFQLVDQRSLMEDHFEPDKELAVFHHESELRGMIRHFTENTLERKRIAEASRRRVLAEHTYEKRMTEVLNYIYSHETKLASRRNPDHVDNIISATDDEELKQFLQKFEDEGVVTVDGIATEIEKSKGEITKPESLFLLMHEFRNWAREKELV